MLPRAWERLSVSFCPVLNVAPAIRQSALFISTFKGEVNGWCKFELLCNDLCWSFLVIFISWLTCKLPNSQRQHWHAVNGCIWPAAVLTASGKARPGCRMPHAPESDWAPSSDSGGWGRTCTCGEIEERCESFGPALFRKHFNWKNWTSDRKADLLPRQMLRQRQTDRPPFIHPPCHTRAKPLYVPVRMLGTQHPRLGL